MEVVFLEIIIMRFILYHFLPFHCRLPTAIKSKLPFAVGNEKHGKTTSIVNTLSSAGRLLFTEMEEGLVFST